MRGSLERARSELAERLRARRGEIEEALLTRTYAIADPKEAVDPEYAEGLRAAVSAALDFGLAAVEQGEERSPQVPVLLLAQARLAARNNIPLDTVLRRYFAGYTTLGDFIVQEAGAVNLKEPWLKRLLREQAALFDRFLAAIGEEHGREDRATPNTSDRRLAEQVERLLAGELLDTSRLRYDFDGFHLGLLVSGAGSQDAIREMAANLDRRLLIVERAEGTIWAWLGGRRPLDPVEVHSRFATNWPHDVRAALGEFGEGLTGWRLTHLQAKAAMAIAQRGPESLLRYADVALLAAALQNDLLGTSLHQLYLAPLERERDSGKVARETLRAYFAAERNVSSAAATLGVKRHTVTNRLRRIEERLSRQLDPIASDLELALLLESLGEAVGAD
jgi:hypothetical protein